MTVGERAWWYRETDGHLSVLAMTRSTSSCAAVSFAPCAATHHLRFAARIGRRPEERHIGVEMLEQLDEDEREVPALDARVRERADVKVEKVGHVLALQQ